MRSASSFFIHHLFGTYSKEITSDFRENSQCILPIYPLN